MSDLPTITPKQREHALLSASGAHRWLRCTPSARLEEAIAESTSSYAEEGRLAHEIGELKLRKEFIEPMGAKTYNSRLKKLQENPLYKPEMLNHTDYYLEYVQSIVHGYQFRPYIAIEKRIDYSTYAPEGFGTGDCIIIGGNMMNVIDFKYGSGVPVSAEGNEQMMLYALGAYIEYSFLYPIEAVNLSIVQPRLDDTTTHTLTIAELLAWGENIKPIAQQAFAGQGEYVPGDKQCRFCRAKATCRARCDTNLALEAFGGVKPPLISNEEVGQILVRAQLLAKWANDLEEYALSEILQGNEVSGWKAVEGRSTRQFTDTDAAFAVVKADGTDEAMLYKREPLTLAAVEKLLGKPKFKTLLTPFVITPPGKPTLAPANDKREAITNKTTAAEVFGAESEGI